MTAFPTSAVPVSGRELLPRSPNPWLFTAQQEWDAMAISIIRDVGSRLRKFTMAAASTIIGLLRCRYSMLSSLLETHKVECYYVLL
jgi:hypothetical protein